MTEGLGWLVVFSAVAVGTASCGPAGAASSASAYSGLPETGAAASADFVPPVRVSRAFFESPVSGELRVASGGPAPSAAGPMSWTEFAPTAPPPAPTEETGPVLADFRDHEGCAAFEQDARGVSLCFNIMGDVSNLGLNEREMKVAGLGQWLDEKLQPSCQGADWDVRFAGGKRDDGSFTVTYVASSPCVPRPVSVEMTLRRI